MLAMPVQNVRALDPLELADDFDDVMLDGNDTKKSVSLVIARPISISAIEYSDSSASSHSSSTNTTEDEDDIVHRQSSSSSNRSSLASRKSDEQDTTDDDNEHAHAPELSHRSNTVNGFAISVLKSKSSLSLLNPNQACINSRMTGISQDNAPLFTPSTTLTTTTTTEPPLSPKSGSSRRHSEPVVISPHSVVSATTFHKSASLLLQATQASQGLRVKPFSKVTTSTVIIKPVLNEEEEQDQLDLCSPLPDTRRSGMRRTLSSPRLTRSESLPYNGLTRSSSTKSVPSQSTPSLVLPYTKQGLTPQQRLRLRRHSSGARLSVEQLELQCDSDDGGDEIPADALAWNVPLSPAMFTKKQQQQQQRPSRPKSAPVSRRDSVRTLESLSCIKESEPTIFFSTTGLEHLSEDARILTRAFQDLPAARCGELQRQAARPSGKLPPKRRSSDFMDPVPISKEKEAVLSRTRPSWLPPKSSYEERRHLSEYQKMMAKAAQCNKAREAKKAKEHAKRVKSRQKDELEWKQNILPRFEKAVSEPKTRELWWRGVPAKYRAIVWKARAGSNNTAKLGITQATYNNALARGREDMNRLKTALKLSDKDCAQKRMLEQLITESSQTLPEVGLYGQLSPVREQLVDILLAFAYYRPDIGYKSGLNSIAAMFLINMRPLDAFTALAGTLQQGLCASLYLHDDERTVVAYYTSFLKVLHAKLPSLYQHFQSLHLPPSAYLEPLLTSLFTEHVSIDISSRIWDVMFFEGDSFLLRVCLAILMKYEHKLYGSAAQILSILGWGAPKLELGHEDEFLDLVRSALKSR